MSAFTTTGPSFYPTLGHPYTDHLRDGTTSNWSASVIPQTSCYPYDTPSLYNPYGDTRYSGMDSAARRKNATRETTNTLKAWLYEHRKNPYPTKGEKIMLAIITKMTLTQVSTWFANARRRLKKENKMTWEPRNKTSDGQDMDDRASLDGDSEQDDLSSTASGRGTTTATGLTSTSAIHGDDHRNTNSPPTRHQVLSSHHLHHASSNDHNNVGHHHSRRSPPNVVDVKSETNETNGDKRSPNSNSITITPLSSVKGSALGHDNQLLASSASERTLFLDENRISSASRIDSMMNGHLPAHHAHQAHFAAAAAEYHQQNHHRFLNQYAHHPGFPASSYFAMSPTEVAAAHHHHHSHHPMLQMLSSPLHQLKQQPSEMASSRVGSTSSPTGNQAQNNSNHHLHPLQSVRGGTSQVTGGLVNPSNGRVTALDSISGNPTDPVTAGDIHGHSISQRPKIWSLAHTAITGGGQLQLPTAADHSPSHNLRTQFSRPDQWPSFPGQQLSTCVQNGNSSSFDYPPNGNVSRSLTECSSGMAMNRNIVGVPVWTDEPDDPSTLSQLSSSSSMVTGMAPCDPSQVRAPLSSSSSFSPSRKYSTAIVNGSNHEHGSSGSSNCSTSSTGSSISSSSSNILLLS